MFCNENSFPCSLKPDRSPCRAGVEGEDGGCAEHFVAFRGILCVFTCVSVHCQKLKVGNDLKIESQNEDPILGLYFDGRHVSPGERRSKILQKIDQRRAYSRDTRTFVEVFGTCYPQLRFGPG